MPRASEALMGPAKPSNAKGHITVRLKPEEIDRIDALREVLSTE